MSQMASRILDGRRNEDMGSRPSQPFDEKTHLSIAMAVDASGPATTVVRRFRDAGMGCDLEPVTTYKWMMGRLREHGYLARIIDFTPGYLVKEGIPVDKAAAFIDVDANFAEQILKAGNRPVRLSMRGDVMLIDSERKAVALLHKRKDKESLQPKPVTFSWRNGRIIDGSENLLYVVKHGGTLRIALIFGAEEKRDVPSRVYLDGHRRRSANNDAGIMYPSLGHNAAVASRTAKLLAQFSDGRLSRSAKSSFTRPEAAVLLNNVPELHGPALIDEARAIFEKGRDVFGDVVVVLASLVLFGRVNPKVIRTIFEQVVQDIYVTRTFQEPHIFALRGALMTYKEGLSGSTNIYKAVVLIGEVFNAVVRGEHMVTLTMPDVIGERELRKINARKGLRVSDKVVAREMFADRLGVVAGWSPSMNFIAAGEELKPSGRLRPMVKSAGKIDGPCVWVMPDGIPEDVIRVLLTYFNRENRTVSPNRVNSYAQMMQMAHDIDAESSWPLMSTVSLGIFLTLENGQHRFLASLKSKGFATFLLVGVDPEMFVYTDETQSASYSEILSAHLSDMLGPRDARAVGQMVPHAMDCRADYTTHAARRDMMHATRHKFFQAHIEPLLVHDKRRLTWMLHGEIGEALVSNKRFSSGLLTAAMYWGLMHKGDVAVNERKTRNFFLALAGKYQDETGADILPQRRSARSTMTKNNNAALALLRVVDSLSIERRRNHNIRVCKFDPISEQRPLILAALYYWLNDEVPRKGWEDDILIEKRHRTTNILALWEEAGHPLRLVKNEVFQRHQTVVFLKPHVEPASM